MALNWKEIAKLVELIRPEVEGARVERVLVPDRPRFPEGYLKGEWVVHLVSAKRGCEKDRGLLFSVRARRPYLMLHEHGEIPKASPHATHSAFDLALHKHLKGARLEHFEALPRERTVVAWFSGKLALAISLIPAAPEAFLVSAERGDAGPWPILARSRAKNEGGESFTPPDGLKAPPGLEVNEENLKSLETWNRLVARELDEEAFAATVLDTERLLKARLKNASEQLRHAEASFREASNEEDWQRFGDLLKAALGAPPPLVKGRRTVEDFEGNAVEMPSDPKLSPSEQVAKFYHLAKRRKRRFEEAQARITLFGESRAKTQASLDVLKKLASTDWRALDGVRGELGFGVKQAPDKKASKGSGGWAGKSFVSKDGLPIWVGRNKTENLELTFRQARGNDLWMHVRGKPGAHVVVPLSSGKSVPLETLLDAANLAVSYSGGQNWGKTEVDYTFKKYVKRIKDSTEASYTHSKTLIVQVDASRLSRLSGSTTGNRTQ